MPQVCLCNGITTPHGSELFCYDSCLTDVRGCLLSHKGNRQQGEINVILSFVIDEVMAEKTNRGDEVLWMYCLVAGSSFEVGGFIVYLLSKLCTSKRMDVVIFLTILLEMKLELDHTDEKACPQWHTV